MSQPDPDITDLANIIRDLRQEVVALQQDNEELRDELARAARAPATPAVATVATTAKPTTAMPVAPPAHTETRQPKMALPKPVHESESSRVTCTGNLLWISMTALLMDPSLWI